MEPGLADNKKGHILYFSHLSSVTTKPLLLPCSPDNIFAQNELIPRSFTNPSE